MRFIADATTNLNDIFGTPVVPPGPNALYKGEVTDNIALLFAFIIKIALGLGGLLLLIYLLWGAFDIVTSGGDKENAAKARTKLTNAVIGIIILVAVIVIWNYLTGIFGLTQQGPGGGIQFKIPGFGK